MWQSVGFKQQQLQQRRRNTQALIRQYKRRTALRHPISQTEQLDDIFVDLVEGTNNDQQ